MFLKSERERSSALLATTRSAVCKTHSVVDFVEFVSSVML